MRFETLILQGLTRIWWFSFDAMVIVLAAWRFSNMLTKEAGPFHVFRHIRQWALRMCRRVKWCREFGLAEWTQCEYCNSIAICTVLWVIYLLIGHLLALILVPFAMSTLVIFLKRKHEQLQR